MNKKMSKRQRDIKTKLMAAVAMLLVSSIMMVSTTYAWFTLSTAPEVTGISTAVGANGNLEMALMPKSGSLNDITSAVGDSTLAVEARNVTWGNLVDLSDTGVYGLDKITLYPSALNAVNDDMGNPTSLETSMLSTPDYGADGRVSQLQANTFTGYYNSQTQNFSPDDYYGVRAVGTASGMTDRQLDYRNSRSAANTARAQAATKASQSLESNGSSLANIAIKYGMNSTNATFNKADVEALRKIIDDLQGNGGVFAEIETAYKQYILAYAASSMSGTEDTVWNTVRSAVNANGATLDSVLTAVGGVDNLPPALKTAINAYQGTDGMKAAVADADSKLKPMEGTLKTNADATFAWDDIRAAMTPLADPTAMLINGFKASEVKEKLGDLVSSVTAQGGLKVIMKSGAGVYADIADQAGDFTASITIERVEYNGIVLNNMAARMETDSVLDPNFYLVAIAAAVDNKAPASGATGTLPISDMYGYIIDMAFRTNAAESKLMLQVDPTDRIYTDNTNGDTMGQGASMTFAATTPDFTSQQVKDLMSAIRIVFFDPTSADVSNKVIATAKLDAANAEQTAEGWKAKIYLYDMTTPYTEASEAAKTDTTTKLFTKSQKTENGATIDVYTAVADKTNLDASTTYYVAGTPVENAKHAGTEGKIEIMPLTQNTAHALSALVYLDGYHVGNEDVAATASTSMTGKMNLQFSSSAALVPMEYAELYQPGEADEDATEYTVTATGTSDTVKFTGAAKTDASADYTFTLTDASDVVIKSGKTVTYKVGNAETATTLTANADGLYTIPKANITGNITITIA